MNSGVPQSSVNDALALARLQRDGRAWLVVAQPATLSSDPTTEFAAAAGRGRLLLWQGGEWVLGIGSAHAVRADGPGRQMATAVAFERLVAKYRVASFLVMVDGLADVVQQTAAPRQTRVEAQVGR